MRPMIIHAAAAAVKHEDLLRRGLGLEYATLGWKVVGLGVLAVAAFGPAPAGFGLESLIEIFASLVVLWQLKGVHADREIRAMRLIGAAFAVLAAYLAGAVLVGLVLNALFGWWWADLLAGLVIVSHATREAVHAFRQTPEEVAA